MSLFIDDFFVADKRLYAFTFPSNGNCYKAFQRSLDKESISCRHKCGQAVLMFSITIRTNSHEK